ncbi:MarR family transcriptional regulator [Pimelobacter simplex]|uniref:MarR family winged helix-turn-helix transcriptional regulator n=1 Tax=Nocardioides simplex TaxID=2045 RepID=UPI00053643A8|nr:MarR family transcriptional regulator [Pimelobacter simplex]MCG8149036.1 MarR family transcriptional regulator [Pimelobacter simplex]GEB14843.1 MarR family transcriptional regulator [Pimelobacter simplex]SFM24497.1 DNA-binding transcriptional regulator, MarR family [Pimelobacter simplex]
MSQGADTPTAVDQVLELAVLLNRDMQLSFERDGLTEARARLLWVLRGGPVTQRELADALAVTPRNVTGLVDGLVATGYVARAPHPTDRRAVLVTLTDAGSTLLTSMVEGYAEMHDLLFGGLSERQLRDLRRSLAIVNDRLRARVEQDWGAP